MRSLTAYLSVLTLVVGSAACGASAGVNAQAQQAPAQAPSTRCDLSLPNLETQETSGIGSVRPNVRRVYQTITTAEDRQRVLICREIDTNLDGAPDVVRRFPLKGDTSTEEADTNHDGRIDTWVTFQKGKVSEERLDRNHDGMADEWRYFSLGQISRIKRDPQFRGKASVWEIYRDGQLERMGVDLNGDDRVDRWDHDSELRRKLEDAERQKDAEAAAKASASNTGEQPKSP